MTTHLKNAEGFVDRIVHDAAFRTQLEAHQSSHEAVLAWAKSEGYDFAAEELREAVSKRQETAAGGSLDDKELQAISGGVLPIVLVGLAGTVLGLSTAAGAVAAIPKAK